MAKLFRIAATLPPFASGAIAADLKVFGDVTESTDLALLLTNANAIEGWAGGVDANGFPALSWFNAVGYTLSSIAATYLQDGIAVWVTEQEYYTGSQAKSGVDGFTYISKTGTAPSTPNPGTTDPSVDTTNWRLAFLDSANTVAFTPTADYHPATKKYTDDAVAAGSGGKVLQLVYDENSTPTVINSTMPHDNTIPQITEGVEVLSKSITPKVIGSVLDIEAVLELGGASNHGVAGLFDGISADAISAHGHTIAASSYLKTTVIRKKVIVTSLSTITFSVRCGSNAAAILYFNQAGTSYTLGGVRTSSLTITEIGV